MLFGLGTIGIAPTFFIDALLFLIMAILFTIKNRCFDTYTKFINPKMYKMCEEKGEEFVRKNRKWSILGFYGIAVVMFLNGFIFLLPSNITGHAVFKFNIEIFIGTGIIAFFMAAAAFLISKYILKRTQTVEEYWLYSLIVGLIGGAIFAIAIAVFFGIFVIYRHS
jgi:hypothetical protein